MEKKSRKGLRFKRKKANKQGRKEGTGKVKQQEKNSEYKKNT